MIGRGGQEETQGPGWRSGLAVTGLGQARQEADALHSSGWRGTAFSQHRGPLLPRRREQRDKEVLYGQVKHFCKEVVKLGRTPPAQVKPLAGIKGLSLHEGQSQQWLSVHSLVLASSRKRVADERGGAGWG